LSFLANKKEGRDAASRARRRNCACFQAPDANAPRPVIVLAPAPVREVFHSRVRIAGGVQAPGSTRASPVRLPAICNASRASAPMRYGDGSACARGTAPHALLSRAAFPVVWEALALTLGHIALASGSNLWT
jgi:hypothetical protein